MSSALFDFGLKFKKGTAFL